MKGQINLIDLLLVPVVAVVLSIVALSLLQGAVTNLLVGVYLQPLKISCQFIAGDLLSNYYVHSGVLYNNPTIQTYFFDRTYANISVNASTYFKKYIAPYAGELTSGDMYKQLIYFLAPPTVSYFKNFIFSIYPILVATNSTIYLLPTYPPPQGFSHYKYACTVPVYNPAGPNFEAIIYMT